MPINSGGFCTVVAPARDGSSFNIFLHGGIPTKGAGSGWSDTYVLSLPSFQWTQLETTGTTAARGGHTCHLVRNKMVVLGGRGGDQANPTWGAFAKGVCDASPLVNVLDVNSLRWDTAYDPDDAEPFRVHKSIYGIIGGE